MNTAAAVRDLEEFMAGLARQDHPAQQAKTVDATYLLRLQAMWMHEAAGGLRDAYRSFGPLVGARRLHKKMDKEVGYRQRERGRLIPQDDPWAGMGNDRKAIEKRIAALVAASNNEFVLVPSRGDRGLVGRPLYPWANPPNPYQWVPVIASAAKPWNVVWEMGPGLSPSAGAIGDLLGRQVVLMCLPDPEKGEQRPRLLYKHGINHVQVLLAQADAGPRDAPRSFNPSVSPSLVLVPLVAPCDVFSITQTINHLVVRGQEAVWDHEPGQRFTVQCRHPEFALDNDSYVKTTVARLKTLDRLVTNAGTKVCTSVPMVRGFPQAIEKAVRRDLGWRVSKRWTVIEEGGARHQWNGTPLVGEALVVWGAQ